MSATTFGLPGKVYFELNFVLVIIQKINCTLKDEKKTTTKTEMIIFERRNPNINRTQLYLNIEIYCSIAITLNVLILLK